MTRRFLVAIAVASFTMVDGGLSGEFRAARAQSAAEPFELDVVAPQGKVASLDGVVLYALLRTSATPTSASFAWSSISGPALPAGTALTSPQLKLAPGSLTPGATYRLVVRVTASFPGGQKTATKQVDVVVNEPPHGGNCTVTASKVPMTSGVTPVTLTTSGWRDAGGEAMSFAFVTDNGLLRMQGVPTQMPTGATFTGPIQTDLGIDALRVTCVAMDARGEEAKVAAAPLPVAPAAPAPLLVQIVQASTRVVSSGRTWLAAQIMPTGAQVTGLVWAQDGGPPIALQNKTNPYLFIESGTLLPGQRYAFSVTVTGTTPGGPTTGVAKAEFVTNTLPVPGTCTLLKNSISLSENTAVVEVAGWTDDQTLPLIARIGYLEGGQERYLSGPSPVGKVKIALPLTGSADLQPFCDVIDGDRERTRKLMDPVRVSIPVRTIGAGGEVVRPHALARPTRSMATSGTIKKRP